MPRIFGALAVAFLLLGCPTRFDPRMQPKLESSNVAADHAFQQARRKFEAAHYDEARTEFVGFAKQFPDDPLAPFAQIFAGRAAYERHDYRGAARLLEAPAAGPPDRAATEQARFYLGLTRIRLGECASARQLLEPFTEKIAPGEDALTLRTALAGCGEKTGDIGYALAQWGAYFELGRDPERAYARGKAQSLADSLPAKRALALYGAAAPGSLARAVLGPKAALEARTTLDPQAAEGMLREVEQLREHFGFGERKAEPSLASSARQDVRLIGCVLPLSGPYKAQGERALRGAAMAVEAFGGGRILLAVRDSAGDRSKTAHAVEELATEEGAVAIVGPIDKGDAEAAAAKAQSIGVPLVELAVAPSAATGPYVFHGVHDLGARVRALAAGAKAHGAKTVAILYPDNAYGRKVRELFGAEAQRGGIAVTAQVSYDAAATSFGSQVRDLKGKRWDALFIPDAASRLELIGPALAAADIWPAMPGAVRQKGMRNIILLSTAENLSSRVLREARYLQGALLAPGYYPEEDSFVQQYRAEHNEDPTLFEAFAYDAVHVVRAVIEGGARDRAQVAAQLGALQGVNGLTGRVRFAPGGDRADPAALYTVIGDAIHRAE